MITMMVMFEKLRIESLENRLFNDMDDSQRECI